MCWFVSMLSLDIKHEIHFYFLKFDSAKRHFSDFTRSNKVKILKGFLHFFWWKSLPARLIPPWYLNEFHIHLWNYFFEIQTWKKLHLHHHMAIKVHISLSSFLFILISFCLRATLIILRYIVLENSKYNLLFKVEKEAAFTQTLVRFSIAVQFNSCKCISKILL